MRDNYFLIEVGEDGVYVTQHYNLCEMSVNPEFFNGFSENKTLWSQEDLCGKPLLIKGQHMIPKPKQVVKEWTE